MYRRLRTDGELGALFAFAGRILCAYRGLVVACTAMGVIVGAASTTAATTITMPINMLLNEAGLGSLFTPLAP